MSIAPLVKNVLAASTQPLTASRIVAGLEAQGFKNVQKTEVNNYLYMAQNNGTVCRVAITGLKAPGWQLSESARQEKALPLRLVAKPEPQTITPATTLSVLSLYRWQKEALGVWGKHLNRGMIEAVTGSGKTRLAFAAWHKLRQEVKPLNTLVVVPTIPLMNQWHDNFQALFPDRRIGRIGDKYRDDFSRTTICVAVINSAVNHVERLLKHCRCGPTKSFLIADECHRYINAPVFSEIRRFPFDYAMALSATIDQFEVQGFGKIIYSYSFADAVRDELVPRFDLINVTVSLTIGEREGYEELTEKIREQIQHVKLLFAFELCGVPDEWFFQKLKQLLLHPAGTEEPSIKYLFSLIFRRAKIIYMAQNKMRLAKEISQLLLNQGRKKMIAFFERIQSAEDVEEDLAVETAEQLRRELEAVGPIWCRVLHSGLPHAERRAVLDEFRANGVSALLTCRVLDEGLDVPHIDAALLVASTQSRRQRIQRIGRALRKGDGMKRPLVITLHVPDTIDGNVTAEDQSIFGDAADFHKVDEADCLTTLKKLLGIASTTCKTSPAMNLAPNDPINQSIWTESELFQRWIVAREGLSLQVGGQQAMPKACDRELFSNESPLPWVPDLVGSEFGNDSRSVLVVASSYNGFIEGYSARSAVLPLSDYITAKRTGVNGLGEFMARFKECVVDRDEDYYLPILRDLLSSAGCELDCCCLTDLCKASFVQRGIGAESGNRSDLGNDTVVIKNWKKWVPYVAGVADGNAGVPLPYKWLWQRMQQCRVVIALGTIAEYGVLKIFQRMASAPTAWSWKEGNVIPDHPTMSGQVSDWEYGYACSQRMLGDWLANEDWWVMGELRSKQRWFMLPVYHPAYAIGRENDINYQKTVPGMKRMIKKAS